MILRATTPAGLIAAAAPQAPLREEMRTTLVAIARSPFISRDVRRRILDVVDDSDRRAHALLTEARP